MKKIVFAFMAMASLVFANGLERWQTCQIIKNTKELKKVGNHFVIVDKTLKKHEKQIEHNHNEIHQNEQKIEHNHNEIHQNEKKIEHNTNNISSLGKKVCKNSVKISKTNKILENTRVDVENNRKNIVHNHREIHKNTKNIDNNTEINKRQQTEINDNTYRISSVEDKVTSLSTALQSTQRQVDENSENIKDLESAMLALSAVDFNPDHEGLSIGVGFSSTGSDSVSGAVGIQYGMGYVDGVSVAVNAKGYVGEGLHHKGVGIGMTLGF